MAPGNVFHPRDFGPVRARGIPPAGFAEDLKPLQTAPRQTVEKSGAEIGAVLYRSGLIPRCRGMRRRLESGGASPRSVM